MNTINKYNRIILGCFLLLSVFFAQAQDNSMIPAIKKEVERNKSLLKIDRLKSPFFISYAIADMEVMEINASLGALLNSTKYPRRIGFPTILIGDYQRNNLNSTSSRIYPSLLPFDNSEGIAIGIWDVLDYAYKFEAEGYETKLSALSQQNQDNPELKIPDYEKVAPFNALHPERKANLDQTYWENYARKASEVTKNYPELTNSGVRMANRNATYYYYDTEDNVYSFSSPVHQICLNVWMLTDDGQEMSDQLYFERSSFEDMPDVNTFIAACNEFVSEFVKLKYAPMVEESYVGPVLFEKMALLELFQQQLFQNNGLIARRGRVGNNNAGGNDTEMMLGKKLISRNLTIKSLTGTKTFEGKNLDGYYPIDFQGVVPSPELTLVDKGVLKAMLNGRTPTLKTPNSNGHARFNPQQGNQIVAPGNVQLLCEDVFSNDKAKQKLIEAAKEEDLEYAYIVRRYRANNPIMVYRVYVEDGREELVRGVRFDTGLRSFRRVIGASDKNHITSTLSFGEFVTYIVPESLLFEEIEVAKSNITLKTPYIIPQPK